MRTVCGLPTVALVLLAASTVAAAPCDGTGVPETLAAARAACCPARNHGAYVSCAAHVCNRAVAAGRLAPSCKVQIFKAGCGSRTTTSSTTTTTHASTTTTSHPATTTTTHVATTTTRSSTSSTTATSTTSTSVHGSTTTTGAGSTTTSSGPSSSSTTATSSTSTSLGGGTTTSSTTVGGSSTTSTTSTGGSTTSTTGTGASTTSTSLGGSTTTTSSTSPATTSTTSPLPGTTTTTLPGGGGEIVEICGNCIDDDGNGLTDFEDPACCPQGRTYAMDLRRLRIRPRGTTSKLVLHSTLARSGLGDVDPLAEDVYLQIRPAGGFETLCAKMPAAKFMRMHGAFKFWDHAHSTASAKGIDDVKVKVRSDGDVRFRAWGRHVLMQTPAAGALTVTTGFKSPTGSDATNRCSTARRRSAASERLLRLARPARDTTPARRRAAARSPSPTGDRSPGAP
jgi:hypothetical protein